MFNQYPYQNVNDLNLDYLLNKIKEIEGRLDNIKSEIEGEIFAWVREQLEPYERELAELMREVESLSATTDATLRAHDARINNFINSINDEIIAIRAELAASIQAVNDLTDLKIKQNNDYIIAKVSEQVGDMIEVLNPFTGTMYTLQDMIDYLAAFHIVDGIDYATMNSRALSYNAWNALNMTYTQLVLHGNTDYQ